MQKKLRIEEKPGPKPFVLARILYSFWLAFKVRSITAKHVWQGNKK